jgi:hypothetical protein
MILMQIVSVMREDEVRINQLLETLKLCFDSGSLIREKTVAVGTDCNPLRSGASQEEVGAKESFRAADSIRTEHNPVHTSSWECSEKSQNGATASNLDIIGVGAQAQNGETPSFLLRQGNAKHAESLLINSY